jgi:hypothetical protein
MVVPQVVHLERTRITHAGDAVDLPAHQTVRKVKLNQ